MKLGFKRGEKGFTLVELMVVMAIIGVLASIIIPSITGTKQLSTDTQVKQDASSVETSVHQYNSEAQGAESITTDSRTAVLGETVEMKTSTRWPEVAITDNYATEFPATVGTTANSISQMIIKDMSGITTYETDGDSGYTMANFVAKFNAIDISGLVSTGYVEEYPTQYNATFSTTKAYHNYLWLAEKLQVGTDIDTDPPKYSGRAVQVYKLMTIEDTGTDVLTYQRIF